MQESSQATILHILHRLDDALALELIGAQRQAGRPVQVVLLQDAVALRTAGDGVFRCRADVEARGLEVPGRLVDYDEIIDLIAAAAKVVCW